jgi:hypothetical protein
VNVAVTGKISAPSTKALSSGQNINITGTGTVTLAAVQSSGDGAHPGGSIRLGDSEAVTRGNVLNRGKMHTGAGLAGSHIA